MARDSRPRSVRRSQRTSGRGRSPRRSPGQCPTSEPRDDSRRRADHLRPENTDKISQTELKPHNSVAGKILLGKKSHRSNLLMWFRVAAAIGAFVLWLMVDSSHVNATMLFREMSKQKDTIDFTKLLNTFMPSGLDPQEWDAKLASIQNLVQATLEHYKTLFVPTGSPTGHFRRT